MQIIIVITLCMHVSRDYVVDLGVGIRECSSTLHVGLANTASPTNTKFKPLLLLTQAGIPYTNSYKHRTSYFKSTLTFLGLANGGSPFLPPDKKQKFLQFLHS